jgi:hypothetical protein
VLKLGNAVRFTLNVKDTPEGWRDVIRGFSGEAYVGSWLFRTPNSLLKSNEEKNEPYQKSPI